MKKIAYFEPEMMVSLFAEVDIIRTSTPAATTQFGDVFPDDEF